MLLDNDQYLALQMPSNRQTWWVETNINSMISTLHDMPRLARRTCNYKLNLLFDLSDSMQVLPHVYFIMDC